jgi:hypothetical protein
MSYIWATEILKQAYKGGMRDLPDVWFIRKKIGGLAILEFPTVSRILRQLTAMVKAWKALW